MNDTSRLEYINLMTKRADLLRGIWIVLFGPKGFSLTATDEAELNKTHILISEIITYLESEISKIETMTDDEFHKYVYWYKYTPGDKS